MARPENPTRTGICRKEICYVPQHIVPLEAAGQGDKHPCHTWPGFIPSFSTLWGPPPSVSSPRGLKTAAGSQGPQPGGIMCRGRKARSPMLETMQLAASNTADPDWSQASSRANCTQGKRGPSYGPTSGTEYGRLKEMGALVNYDNK